MEDTKTGKMNPLLKETIVFRPFGGCEGKGIIATTSGYKHPTGSLHYANGQWLPDDGKPDLAFVQGVFAYGVLLPDYTNILWAWYDRELEKSLVGKDLEKFIHGWHYLTINNEEWLDHPWERKAKESHPNEIAFRAAMDKCCEYLGCANGRGPYLTQDNEWIQRGQIWVKSTMEPVTKPENPVCYQCLNNGEGHKREAFNTRIRHHKEDKEILKERIPKLELDLYDARDELEKIKEHLAEWETNPLYDNELAAID